MVKVQGKNTIKKLPSNNKKATKKTPSWEWTVVLDKNISVITKTTAPKVVIQSENVKYADNANKNIYDHKVFQFILAIVMCIIILITFFISLKTYNTLNSLSDYIIAII